MHPLFTSWKWTRKRDCSHTNDCIATINSKIFLFKNRVKSSFTKKSWRFEFVSTFLLNDSADTANVAVHTSADNADTLMNSNADNEAFDHFLS